VLEDIARGKDLYSDTGREATGSMVVLRPVVDDGIPNGKAFGGVVDDMMMMG